ncbi:M48 family metallopeptidase [Desulfobacula toluolica]|uniref:Peptidase, M48 family protein n=1 Tax=Desulfobacula toluolica (strain DSM 7467 / Tol2) TaxID=651182 RepID=K0N386_DESTT|nr:M48 family metallopeptidase [Desulfobacula toluolica]CCK78569.1 peptidase, M48 family protein [Desulfobacula toluolica Tol2]
MKKYFFIIIILFLSLFSAGCENTDFSVVTDAGIDAIKAVTLSDENVKKIALKASRQSDIKHKIAPLSNLYGKRLYNLIGTKYSSNGYDFNFKVYLSPVVNAFAMADGTIRIYSGLMDMLNDEELLFVLGHEMGHVVEKHIKKKIRLAYAGRAIRKGIASQENIAGDIARSSFGGLIELLINAQFSQQEEREADDFGIAYLQEKGLNLQSAVSALKKIATLGNKHSFLSSHPAPEVRAKRLQNQIDNPEKTGDPSLVEQIISRLKEWKNILN